MINENTIHMISDLYRVRKAMQMLWEDDYQTKVTAYKNMLIRFMEKNNIHNPIEAAIDIADKNESILNGSSLGLLFAASIELSESSYENKELTVC